MGSGSDSCRCMEPSACDNCSIAVSRLSDLSEESSDETVVDCIETMDRSELSEASELGLVMSIILGVLTALVAVGIGTEGNGKAVDLLDLDVPREDMVFVSAETKEDWKYFKSTDSVLVLILDDARVCDLKQGIFLITID